MCIRDSPCDTLGVYPFIPHQIQRIESTLGEILGENMTEPPRTARLCTVQMYRTKVWILPGISTFVGADIVSDILSCGLDVYKRQPFILADEPTGNLDEDTAAEITDILMESAHELDKCVIVVTHSRELAKRADIVWKLKGGSLQRVSPCLRADVPGQEVFL